MEPIVRLNIFPTDLNCFDRQTHIVFNMLEKFLDFDPCSETVHYSDFWDHFDKVRNERLDFTIVEGVLLPVCFKVSLLPIIKYNV